MIASPAATRPIIGVKNLDAPGFVGVYNELRQFWPHTVQAINYRCNAENAGIRTKIGCHTFRATGITEYLRNGGKLEIAQQMANHESARTTGLYDRRDDLLTLDEVERILI